MSGMAASDASSIPLRVRVMAWWRGYDAAEYHAWQSGAVPERPSSMESLIQALPDLSEFDYTQARVDVLQRLLGPGNAEIGRAPRRESVCAYVETAGDDVSIQK